jgi:hypothetical protein
MDDIQRLKQLELSVRLRLKRICVDIAKERKRRAIDKDKLNSLKERRRQTDILLNQVVNLIKSPHSTITQEQFKYVRDSYSSLT